VTLEDRAREIARRLLDGVPRMKDSEGRLFDRLTGAIMAYVSEAEAARAEMERLTKHATDGWTLAARLRTRLRDAERATEAARAEVERLTAERDAADKAAENARRAVDTWMEHCRETRRCSDALRTRLRDAERLLRSVNLTEADDQEWMDRARAWLTATPAALVRPDGTSSAVEPVAAAPVTPPIDWQEVSETWRKSCVAWQDWASGLLHNLGLQPEGGEHGSEAARELIGLRASGDRRDPVTPPEPPMCGATIGGLSGDLRCTKEPGHVSSHKWRIGDPGAYREWIRCHGFCPYIHRADCKFNCGPEIKHRGDAQPGPVTPKGEPRAERCNEPCDRCGWVCSKPNNHGGTWPSHFCDKHAAPPSEPQPRGEPGTFAMDCPFCHRPGHLTTIHDKTRASSTRVAFFHDHNHNTHCRTEAP